MVPILFIKHDTFSQYKCICITIVGYFRGGILIFHECPCSGAIIYAKIFHECMALNNNATLNSANFHCKIFHELSSIHKSRESSPPRK